MCRLLMLMVVLLPVVVHADADSRLIQAAEAGIADAQYDLAILYERGEGGVKQNAAKARQWYESAAKNGHTGAKAWLAKVVKRESLDSSGNGKGQDLRIEMVTIGGAFRIGKYEVTQKQWKVVMGNNPSRFSKCGDNCPVEQVSWDDVQTFLTKLNQMTGRHYRLPTEQEWLRACKAKKAYCWDSQNANAVAWHLENSDGKTHPVGQKQADANGLYDMSGNVWEWIFDCWSGDCQLRMHLGGSFGNHKVYLEQRTGAHIDTRSGYIGFRLAQDL